MKYSRIKCIIWVLFDDWGSCMSCFDFPTIPESTTVQSHRNTNIALENWWLGDGPLLSSSLMFMEELLGFGRVHVVTCSNANLRGNVMTFYDHVSHMDFTFLCKDKKSLTCSSLIEDHLPGFFPNQHLCIEHNIIPAWLPCETPRTPVISVDSTACHVIKDVVNDFRMRGETKTPFQKSQGFWFC